jgi:hypothetical protein
LCAPFSNGSFLSSAAPSSAGQHSIRLPEIRQIDESSSEFARGVPRLTYSGAA